ncbi:hypothetical protein [Cryptosporangium sp. NPDC048952]|uniref:hypothetical protein n=1 Tax=Cryptosporangium sp. NPDC048952 TaxID=3363961 RepID=UPI00371F3287
MTEPSGALAALERRVEILEERAEMESGFRAGIERDLDTIKRRQLAQHELLQATYLTQSEHSGCLSRIETSVMRHGMMLADHGQKLTNLETKMTNLETKVTTLEGGVSRIIGMLDTLIAREN